MAPIRSVVDDFVSRVRHHILFVGPRRIVAGALTAGVLALAGWLLFSPAPPTVESVLPPAGSARVAHSTLPSGAVPTGTVAGGTVRVHVAGAVRRPGVYEVPADGRIIDAVRDVARRRFTHDTLAGRLIDLVAGGLNPSSGPTP